MGGSRQHRHGQRQARGWRGRRADGHHRARLLSESRRLWKERRGVPVLTEAEEDKVKARNVSAEIAAQHPLVLSRRILSQRKRRRHRMDVFGRAGNMVKERLFGHRVVAACIAGRDVALIGPEDVDARPGDRIAKPRRQQGVQRLRRATARQCHSASATAVHGIVDDCRCRLGHSKAERTDVGGHAHFFMAHSASIRRAPHFSA